MNCTICIACKKQVLLENHMLNIRFIGPYQKNVGWGSVYIANFQQIKTSIVWVFEYVMRKVVDQ